MSILYRMAITVGFLCVALSFWFGSRFTADDSFITWRYGKNLIDAGIWNYNPSALDPTQAYTNPIYALISIVPHLINFDVVLFFKLLAAVTLIAFAVWFLSITKRSLLALLLLLAPPATMIHIFGGLETFLFVFLMSALLVALDKEQVRASIILTLLLFVTRPESWILVALVPIYLSSQLHSTNSKKFWRNLLLNITRIQLNVNKLFTTFLFLAIPLTFYFFIHYQIFGNPLPNTFYAKSGAIFLFKLLIVYSFFMLPAVLLLMLGRIKIFLFISVFFGIVACSYAKSYLMMNYASRFAFHIFVPIYCFMIYIAAEQRGKIMTVSTSTENYFQCSVENFVKAVAVIILCFFVWTSGIRAIGLFTSYPRLLASHGQLGKVITAVAEQYGLNALAIGDAGIAPYQTKLNNLDIVGLGSSIVVRDGLAAALNRGYSIDLIAFYATPHSIQKNLFSQHLLLEWATKKGFSYLCDIYWQPDYVLKLYTKQSIPELELLCKKTHLENSITDQEYFKKIMFIPPWHYWHQ